jgi:DHA1 family inner membrane transport protein
VLTDTSPKQQQENSFSRFAWKAGAATLCRLVLNTARRFAYPFAPALSRGLDVRLTAVTSLIAINQATSIIGIFFGPLADRFGYRLMMVAGLVMLSIGMLAGGFIPFYSVIVLAFFLAGLAKTVFDPALQAYVGERVPFQRRGLVIGLLEFSWAGSTLVGIPGIALLIDRLGWRAPFFVLGGLGIFGILTLLLLIPGDTRRADAQQGSSRVLTVMQQLVKQRAPLGTLGFALLFSIANDNLFVVYGAWLEQSFKLSIVALGIGTSIIGVAELLGESLTASFGDRLGLKRSIIIGIILSVVCYLILPFSSQTLPLAFMSLFALFLIFEFTIVSSLSLSTELLPASRATMMSGFFAAAGVGRVIGSLMGSYIWLAGGILATGLVSGIICGVALVSFTWGLHGRLQ